MGDAFLDLHDMPLHLAFDKVAHLDRLDDQSVYLARVDWNDDGSTLVRNVTLSRQLPLDAYPPDTLPGLPNALYLFSIQDPGTDGLR